jgi:hypothetical protein
MNTWLGLKMSRVMRAMVIGAVLVSILCCSPSQAAELEYTQEEDGVTITVDGDLFTRYVFSSGTKPILYPVVGPSGVPVTRSYPIEDARPHESKDHPHHRSLWFGYQGINGVDFWLESSNPKKPRPTDGRQIHRGIKKLEKDGDTILLVTENDYVDAADKVVAKDERTIRFGTEDSGARWIDYTIKLWSPSGPLKLSDTKEGAFAVRVAGSMDVAKKLGGTFVNSHGDVDQREAWGKPAAWVDYQGPVEGEDVGIAILAHPSSLQAEPRWHVRDYGLFTANPIGAHDYSGGKVKGGLERAEGEPIVLRHRVIVHKGDHLDADIAGAYARYAESE